jgi:hypothetical protein
MSDETPGQPKLAELLTRYLARQSESQGLGALSQAGDVQPYEAAPLQPTEPRLAWDEARVAFAFYGSAGEADAWLAPPHWETLVAAHEPAVGLALALGNFPQLVRRFHQLLHEAEVPPAVGAPVVVPELLEWADARARQLPQMLMALGALRLAKQFEAAEDYVRRHERHISAPWRAGWENEKAALAWHAGDAERARQLWGELAPTGAVLFNRGMADLFVGQGAAARAALAAAVERMPEQGAWQHLARLYLTLASMRA